MIFHILGTAGRIKLVDSSNDCKNGFTIGVQRYA